MLNIAINGFGRIGRNVLRALYFDPANRFRNNINIVAINDLGETEIHAHLLKFDSVHGQFTQTVSVSDKALVVNGNKIPFFHKNSPAKLPWSELGVDIVLECTGLFTNRESAQQHIDAGAKKVIVSAPCKGADATIVVGVNHDTLNGSEQIISNASCTTNCLAPLAKVFNDSIGIQKGLMTTIHAATNDQKLTDAYHSDLYRARASMLSMIPTKTGAAEAVGLVLPDLAGRLDGLAIRVPTTNVSLVDFTFVSCSKVSVTEIHALVRHAADSDMEGILAINELPLVSCDFNHRSESSLYDSNHTKVIDKLVKVLAWYDNEWGFSNRLLDNCLINAAYI